MGYLLLRNLIFTIVQPGLICYMIPRMIVRNDPNGIWHIGTNILSIAGVILVVAGIILLLPSIYSFAKWGRGTLSPAMPTKHLVVSGFYRYSRNPMYIGVILILLGE